MRNPERRALAMIEAALVFPLLLLLLMGLLEYSWLLLQHQQLTNAARHGTRIGVRADSTGADIDAAIASLMNSAGMGASGYAVTKSAVTENLNPGEILTVSIEVPYPDIDLNMPLVPVPAMLRASISMMKEGPSGGSG